MPWGGGSGGGGGGIIIRDHPQGENPHSYVTHMVFTHIKVPLINRAYICNSYILCTRHINRYVLFHTTEKLLVTSGDRGKELFQC